MATQPALESSDHGTSLGGDVLELIATGAPLSDALDALCRAIDERSGGMSAVFLLNREGDRLSQAAAPHFPAEWRDATRSFEALPTMTSCGAAIHRREPVIVSDVLSSPLFTSLREVARANGIHSVWSTPFFSKEGQVLGTFAVASHEEGKPSEAHFELVSRATHLASIAVERHLTEKELRESELRFSTSFYASPALMTITRFSDGRFLYVNDAFVRMLGYSRAETIGQTALSLGLYPDPGHRPILMQLLTQRKFRDVETKARTKSGRILDLVLSMERVELQGEESVLQIASDITARKRAEEGVAASERRWRSVFDNSAIGIAIGDVTLRITAANRAVQELGGYSERELTGLTFLDLTHPDDRHLLLDATSDLLAGRARERQFEKRYLRKNGEVIWVRTTVSMIQETNESPMFLALIEDVSARKTAERALAESLNHLRALTAKLLRAQDEERRRIAQMLHETTAQDLAALKMLLGRLGRTSVALSEEDRSVLDESVALAERSMGGVRTMSYLLYPPFLDENGLLPAIRWYAKGFADRSGIAVDLDLPETLDRLPQEVETTLFRVVQEALINIHHHAGSSTARIRLSDDGGRLVLEIEDRGRGMSADLLARLKAGGAAYGIGLAGMRERLEQLGGALDIDSTDRGSTIRATVPLPAHPA
jgi:PAS domain S-box-containing protein